MNGFLINLFQVLTCYWHLFSNRKFSFIVCAIVFSAPSIFGQQMNLNEGLLFSLNFEQGLTANSKGIKHPFNKENLPKITSGINGKGATFKDLSFLEYESEHNINKAVGTITMWVQTPTIVPGKNYLLFKEGGTIDNESTALSLVLSDRFGLRATVGNSKENFVATKTANLWKKNEWHHLALSWNRARGLSLYIDGNLTATKLTPAFKKDLSQLFNIGGADGGVNYEPWSGMIDEFSIFDHELTESEVFENYFKLSKSAVQVKIINPFISEKKADSITLMLLNKSARPASINDLILEIGQNGKKEPQKITQRQLINPKSYFLLKIPIATLNNGKYPFTFTYRENELVKHLRDTIYAIQSFKPTKKQTEKSLVQKIGVVATKPLAESLPSNIIQSNIGNYRETGYKKHDRFAFEFHISDVDQPHLAIIKYPDDKARTMEVILQDLTGLQDYQAQAGIITGDEYALSGKTRELRITFWPKSKNLSFIFMTAENGRPAAISGIEIYKLNNLAAVELNGKFKGSVPARNTGIYYEDPVLNKNFGEQTDFAGFEKSTTRLLDYMESFGQTSLNYPMVWYNGPLYTTALQSGQGDTGGARPHPTGYFFYLMKVLQQRRMKFNAGIHTHTLPSLEQLTTTDKNKVAEGTETILNVKSDGNVLFNRFHGSDPGLNPISPLVQKSVADVVSEIADQYANEPAFDGITLVMARVKPFTFGSLESGYNDINLQRFQNETGLVIPTYQKEKPDRFSASYKWLIANPSAKTAWINWRCKQFYIYYKSLADKLSTYRKDLKLTLNVFVHVAFYNRTANYLREDPMNVLKESGFDPELYKDLPNIVLSFTEVPADYRMRRANLPQPNSQEAYRTVFTSGQISKSLTINTYNGTSVIVHDRYWEDDIGKTKPLKFKGYDNLAEHPWRVATLNPMGIFSLEPYVFALNNMDATKIEKGGFLIGTLGIEDDILRFSAVFQKLPAVKFDEVKDLSDPIRIRQKVVDGRLYFYVLNCLPTTVKTHISLNKTGIVKEPGFEENMSISGKINLNMEPYELKVFESDVKDIHVAGANTEVNLDWLKELTTRLEKINKTMELLEKKSLNISPYKPNLALANKYLQELQYSRLHFLLQENWAMEIERLATTN